LRIKYESNDGRIYDTEAEALKADAKKAEEDEAYRKKHLDDCYTCNGSGRVVLYRIMSDDITDSCPTCKGTGKRR
jgi:DnaJ-class molecular chaperone